MNIHFKPGRLIFLGVGAVTLLSVGYLRGQDAGAAAVVGTPIQVQHPRGVRDLAYSPDGKLLASVGDDRKVVLWDTKTGAKVHEMWGAHKRNINLVAFSPNGQVVVAASLDESVSIWSVATGKLIQKIDSPKGNPEWLKFAPDSSSFTFATQEGTMVIVPLRWS